MPATLTNTAPTAARSIKLRRKRRASNRQARYTERKVTTMMEEMVNPTLLTPTRGSSAVDTAFFLSGSPPQFHGPAPTPFERDLWIGCMARCPAETILDESSGFLSQVVIFSPLFHQ